MNRFSQIRTQAFLPGLLIALAACSAKDPAPTSEDSDVEKGIITVSQKMNTSLPLISASVQQTNRLVVLSGRVEFDPNKVTKVYSLVTGTIERINVNQGDVVRKGQVLAEVYSSDVASAISDFQKARTQKETTERAMARMKRLFETKLIAQSDLDQAASDEAQARADFERSRKTLRLLGGVDERTSAENPTSTTFQIVAPMDGTVVERLAQPGSQIRNDGTMAAFTIGSTSSIWVTLDAYPEQLKSLSVGDSVVIKASGMDEHSMSSRIEDISPLVDPTTFTTKIRCTLPNNSGELKPAMFVSATVHHPDVPGLFIPSAGAFYDADGKVYVFAKAGARSYKKQEIAVAETVSDRLHVTSGLSAGDSIVADNALFLNDELQANQK